MWYESMPKPRLGQSARHTTSQAVVNSLMVRPQERPSYAILMPSGTASMASLRRSRAIASRSCVAWVEVEEQASKTLQSSAAHISSMDLAMSTLYWCRWPDRPSKSRST